MGERRMRRRRRGWVRWHAIVVEDDYTLGLVN
jgi:hypothetical protein